MDYMWQEFNIKTFPAETIVFRDGVFMPDLSSISEIKNQKLGFININKAYDLPVHIIYIGKIDDLNNLEININIPNHQVFLTVKTENKMPAFLNIFVKNTGKNSVLQGNILIQNYSEFGLDITGTHQAVDTGILVKTKIVAHSASETRLTGQAIIEHGCENCESDIGFSVLAAPDAKIKLSPRQLISAIPKSAEHSASIYRGTAPQIEYLRTTGLSGEEVKSVLRETFISDLQVF